MTSKIAVAAALLFAVSAVPARSQAPAAQDVQVTITKLAGNVYGVDGQGGRISALVGPDGVFLVDAQFPQVTEKIVAALKTVSDGRVKMIVNTHVHGDHTGGNENFGKMGAVIMSRPNLRARLIKPAPGANGQVPPPAPAAALPVVTYDQPLTIQFDGEEVRIVPLPPSHTDGDTAVKFVNANVLMTGDVYRSEGYPAAAVTNGGSVLGILTAIDQFLAITDANTKVVPGHGPVSNRAGLVFHREVLVTVRDRVSKLMKEGKTLEQIQAAKPTADFDARVAGPPNFIAQFVTTLYNELSAAK